MMLAPSGSDGFLSAIHAEAIIGNSSYGPLMGGITMVSLCG